MRLFLIIVSTLLLLFGLYGLTKDRSDFENLGSDFYRTTGIVSKIENFKGKSFDYITLDYYTKDSSFRRERYSRSIIDHDTYKTGDKINIWVNSRDHADFVIENILPGEIKKDWAVVIIATIIFIGSVFWKQLKGIIAG